jgi:serine/threonine protein kinase/tetratricopeptide (TPR) repeat protein
VAEFSTKGEEQIGERAEPPAAATDRSGVGRVDDFERNDDVLARGATVGRYLVLERLGAGAMGVVYAAYDPELDRKVAIKILRPSEGSGDPARRQARLVREAKAMARLSHPNVGAIFDVGVHQEQVFLAMEYLPGGTLRRWIEAEKRSWRETVKMFIEVGHGLAAAHAEGLIHRDFKPDNVLLDKANKPKVVDFGLVRLTANLEISTSGAFDDPDLPIAETAIASSVQPGGAVLTRTGALTGTPAYMAPEQFLGKVIDERTDQFAFCVALYEALYTERPFTGDTVIALADSVTSERMVGPPKGTSVPGWIRGHVVRGLRCDAKQRHRSIDDLLAALTNDPARRTRKWVLAGTTLVATFTIAAVTQKLSSDHRPTMCTGGGDHLVGIWEASAAPSARKEAIHRAFARTGKSYAEQAYTGVARLLDRYVERWTGMYTEACQATHLRGEQSAEVLDLRMACLNERLGNARALSDVFAVADGKVLENAVSAAAALPSLDRCADVSLLRAVIKPPEDAATRTRVDALRVELAKLIALRDSGQCARAIPKADTLIADVRAVGYQPLLADTLFSAAQMYNNCGDAAEMLPHFKEAHAVAIATHDDEVAAQASALIPSIEMNRFGHTSLARDWLQVAQGDVARLGRETLADAMFSQAEGMLAVTDRAYDRALAAADHSIEVTARLLGPDDPLTIQWEANKGDWLEAAGRLGEALQTDVRVREQFERLLGRDHPRIAVLWNNEGEVLTLLGRYPAAEAAYLRAVQLFRQSGADSDVLAWALTGLGRALLGKMQPATAIAPLEEALAIRLEKRVPSPQLGETRFALARALWSRSDERRRALALANKARDDYGDDKKAAAEIDVWRARAREGRAEHARDQNDDEGF